MAEKTRGEGGASWFVTGANRGIGLAFAAELTRRGDRVIGTARDPGRATELRETGARVEELDLSDPRSIAGLGERLAGEPIDVIVHNAGRGDGAGDIARVGPAELEAFFAVNAIGPMLLTRALLPALERGDRRLVVAISSGLASISRNDGGWYGYRASKAALNMFVRTLAADLAPKKFTCVLLSPGWVRTEMGGPGAPLSPEKSVHAMLAVIGRLNPEDSGSFFDHRGRVLPW